MNDYLIFGATGLTGKNFLSFVKEEGSSYHLYVRNLIKSEEEKNQTIFSQDNIPELPNSKNLVICLGYPLAFKDLVYMNENTKKEFKKVDMDLVIKVAKQAISKEIQNITIVSAVGSKKNSVNFYLNIKAKMEDEILKLGFNKTIFAKPGHLIGSRDSSRIDIWVKLIEFFGMINGIFLIGPLRKYKNIKASKVAFEMISMINKKKPKSNYLIEVYENI